MKEKFRKTGRYIQWILILIHKHNDGIPTTITQTGLGGRWWDVINPCSEGDATEKVFTAYI